MGNITSFFDKNYKTPSWLNNKISRRHLLKSAAGASMIAAMPAVAFTETHQAKLNAALKTDPWLTLDAVLFHLLPEKGHGPSAKDIQAVQYLYNLVHLQPTAQDEVEFVYKGVGWLNGFTTKQLGKNFVELSDSDKDKMLRAISRSRAGENWINMLISNLYEAMLSPPIYGGNPNGVGWQWLKHKPGFPLPKEGDRYYELPQRSRVKSSAQKVTVSDDAYAYQQNKKGLRKA